jgi:hypothetical protein
MVTIYASRYEDRTYAEEVASSVLGLGDLGLGRATEVPKITRFSYPLASYCYFVYLVVS